MTDTRDDGGPAFPSYERWTEYTETGSRTRHEPIGGMKLRDYFAGQALAGMRGAFDEEADLVAAVSYQIADAMLKARQQP